MISSNRTTIRTALRLTAIATAATMATVSANAATLITYDLTGTAGSQTTQPATTTTTGLTAQAIARGAGLAASAAGSSFSSTGWTSESTDYITFGFNVAAGYTATFSELALATRSSGTGPGFLTLTYSVDGGAFQTLSNLVQSNTDYLYTDAFTATPVTVTSSLVFRIVQASNTTQASGTGATAAAGTFRLADTNGTATQPGTTPITISGTVSQVTGAVPEPATWAIFILGFAAVGGAMRRSRASVRFA